MSANGGDGGESKVRKRPAAARDTDGLLRVVATSGGRDDPAFGGRAASCTVESLLARDAAAGAAAGAAADPTGEEAAVFSGYLLKRGYRFGNLLSGCPACCGCKPVWKKRFFVLRGGYLFRFASNTRTARPKGVPEPLSDAYIDAAQSLDDGGADAGEADNVGDLLIHISTIRKEYLLKAGSLERRNEWIRRLRRAKERSIKVSLGHATQSAADKAARRHGQELFQQGLRREIARTKQEVEMRSAGMGGMGGGF